MLNLDSVWTEILKYGIVGTFLILSLAVNVYLWRTYQHSVKQLEDCHREQIALVAQHEDEKSALYDRFIASRDTLIDKYNDYVRQADKTIGDILRAFQSRGGPGA